jgi:hypothetical protein
MVSKVQNSVGFLFIFVDFFITVLADLFFLAHILRLLATHHIIRERSPNIFTMNRISSLLDSGKSVAQIRQWESEARLVAVSFVYISPASFYPSLV